MATDCAKTCPSGRARPGSLLIGVVGTNGRVAFISPGLRIEDEGVEGSSGLERKMRFAERCVEAGCRQWTGESCGVIDRVLEAVITEAKPDDDELPLCAIRPTCRWYYEHGKEACQACVWIVTDTRMQPA